MQQHRESSHPFADSQPNRLRVTQHQRHPLPSLPTSNLPSWHTHAPNLTTYIHHYHYYNIEGNCTVHQAPVSRPNSAVIVQHNQHQPVAQNPPLNQQLAPLSTPDRFHPVPNYSYSPHQGRTQSNALGTPQSRDTKQDLRSRSNLVSTRLSAEKQTKERASSPLPKPEALFGDGKRTLEISAATSQVNQRRPLGLRLPTLFVPPPAPATTSTSPPSSRSDGIITTIGDSMNDWERVVAMYMTGAGAPDGKPLREIKRGCGTRVDDRKLLEKRRTIGKTYERLGRVAFERAIGYTNEKGGQRRKQRMYQVIARCRVVSKMYKMGETLPDDPDTLTELIEKRLAEKVAPNSRDLLRAPNTSVHAAAFPEPS